MSRHLITGSVITDLDPLDVQIIGATGRATAMPSDTYTRPADTTQYAAGDQVCNWTDPAALEFAAARLEGGAGVILDALCIDSANQSAKPNLHLYLFDAEPTPNNDNAPWTPTDVELTTLIGVVEFTSWDIGAATVGAGGNCASVVKGLYLPFKALPASTSIWGLLVERGTYTPVLVERLTVRLGISQD